MMNVAFAIAIILVLVLLIYSNESTAPRNQEGAEIEQSVVDEALQVLGTPAARRSSEGYRAADEVEKAAPLESGRIVVLDVETEAPIAGALVKDSSGSLIGESDQGGT